MSEFSIIKKLRKIFESNSPEILLGSGDDAAVIEVSNLIEKKLAVTVDAMVEGIHFIPAHFTPQQLGRRATSVALSDLAAMGAIPMWVLVSLGIPEKLKKIEEKVIKIAEGIKIRLSESGGTVVGGNITGSPALFISITAIGLCKQKPLTRMGAVPGDMIAVTGNLGDSALGLNLLKSGRINKKHPLARKYIDPPARIREGIEFAKFATACIDISDGLLQDLGHIVEQSSVGAIIEIDKIPLPEVPSSISVNLHKLLELALCGGEDYELLISLNKKDYDLAKQVEKITGTKITVIGHFTEDSGKIKLINKNGKEVKPPVQKGWDHFK